MFCLLLRVLLSLNCHSASQATKRDMAAGVAGWSPSDGVLHQRLHAGGGSESVGNAGAALQGRLPRPPVQARLSRVHGLGTGREA